MSYFMMESKPLLKFSSGGEAKLDPSGLELLKAIRGQICPFVFLGDGRAGKSYLASALLGQDGVFTSSDTSVSVTEGIDVAVGPANARGEHVLVLDCEGGNNALAEIHSLVNVIALVACTHVVFVANSMASEASLQCLASAIAARSVVHSEEDCGFQLPRQLTFVVNKTTLKYGGDALEKLLHTSGLGGEGLAGREEVRQDIKAAFPDRRFIAVPHNVLPEYDQSLATFKRDVYASRQPMTVGGVPVHGQQFCTILELIAKEVGQVNTVSVPSMTRAVIFDGFLKPLVSEVVAEARRHLPPVEDYDPDIERHSPLPRALASFDEAISHLAPQPLLSEARARLLSELEGAWTAALRRNEALGEATAGVATETREKVEREELRCLGGTSLLRDLVVTEQFIRVESRAVVQKRRGGEPVCSEWELSRQFKRLRDQQLEDLSRLPRMQGRMAQQLRTTLGHLFGSYEPCFCILRDLHLMWWTLPYRSEEPTQCFNLLEHTCSVEAAGAEASFVVTLQECPKAAAGNTKRLLFHIREPASFLREISCCTGLQRPLGLSREQKSSDVQLRDKWLASLREHAALAASVTSNLVCPPSLETPKLRDVWDRADFRDSLGGPLVKELTANA